MIDEGGGVSEEEGLKESEREWEGQVDAGCSKSAWLAG